MISLKELIQQPIPNLTFKFNDIDDLKKLQQVVLLKVTHKKFFLIKRQNLHFFVKK